MLIRTRINGGNGAARAQLKPVYMYVYVWGIGKAAPIKNLRQNWYSFSKSQCKSFGKVCRTPFEIRTSACKTVRNLGIYDNRKKIRQVLLSPMYPNTFPFKETKSKTFGNKTLWLECTVIRNVNAMNVLNGSRDFDELIPTIHSNRTLYFILKKKILCGYITCCKCVRLALYQLYLETVEEKQNKIKICEINTYNLEYACCRHVTFLRIYFIVDLQIYF